MVRLLILGTAHSVADETHRHTHLAVVGERGGLLIDCGVCPRSRLEDLGVGRDRITDIVITHFHPDHVSGLPLYIMELSLTGRRLPLAIHASPSCLQRIEAMLDLFALRRWPNMFPISFLPIPSDELAPVLSGEEFAASASPMIHLVPTTAVRVDLAAGGSVVFSSDTEPSDLLVRLAKAADVLLHEASGEGVGHSSAAQAGEVARRAEAKRLILVHYDPSRDPNEFLREAKSVFPGRVDIAFDRMEIPLGSK
jgi:ribonuclease Z